MIRIQRNNDTATVYIKKTLSINSVFEFLQNRGYTVKQWLWKYEDETFPGGITYHES